MEKAPRPPIALAGNVEGQRTAAKADRARGASGTKEVVEKIKDLGDQIDMLRGERRHELRKALKKLRYQAEFFSDLYPRTEAQAFIKNLKSLQKLFGYVNDARMATQLLEIASDRNVSLKSASAAGFVVGYHEAEASQLWNGAKTAWKELRNSKQFWRH